MHLILASFEECIKKREKNNKGGKKKDTFDFATGLPDFNWLYLSVSLCLSLYCTCEGDSSIFSDIWVQILKRGGKGNTHTSCAHVRGFFPRLGLPVHIQLGKRKQEWLSKCHQALFEG